MTAASLQSALQSLHASADDTRTAAQAVAAEVDALLGERIAIAQILADFYRAPLSMSSVQPLLDLAVRLNPSLARPTSVEPVKVRTGDNCGSDHTRVDPASFYVCSRIKGHTGPHRAYCDHDSSTGLLAEWA